MVEGLVRNGGVAVIGAPVRVVRRADLWWPARLIVHGRAPAQRNSPRTRGLLLVPAALEFLPELLGLRPQSVQYLQGALQLELQLEVVLDELLRLGVSQIWAEIRELGLQDRQLRLGLGHIRLSLLQGIL